MKLPTKSGDYLLSEELADAYRKIYPSADYEFARMLIWLESNAARRPASPKSAPKFVRNWFDKLPRIAPRVEARNATMAALTGGSNVIELGRGRDRAPVRADAGGLWGAEDVVDVDWREPRGGETDMGRDALALPHARTASGG